MNSNLILLGLLLFTKSCFGWWMTDQTPEWFEDAPIQFNEIRENPPTGCNNDWWELNQEDFTLWLKSNKKIIYVQEIEPDGTIYRYVVKVIPD